MKKMSYQITLQFTGGESDREALSNDLTDLEGVKALVYPDPTPIEERLYSFAFSTDYVVNSVVTIIATAGSIATIANLIHSLLKDRREKKTKDGKLKKIFVKTNSKYVEITGDLSEKAIVQILKEASTIANSEEALRWLRNRQNELDRRKIQRRLRIIEKALPEYRKLLELYEKDEHLEPWQEEDYARHNTSMKSLEDEVESLKKTLRELEKLAS